MEYVDQTSYAGITRIRYKGMISAFVSIRHDYHRDEKGTPKDGAKLM